MVHTLSIKHKAKRVLIISDTHFPFEHPDTFKFLKALKKKYNPDLVCHVGDIVDMYRFSRYKHHPDFISPKQEVEKMRKKVKKLQEIFPNLYLTLGNHCTRILDKAEEAGIPTNCMMPIEKILGITRKGWKLCTDLRINWKDERRRVLITHGKYSDPLKTAALEGCNAIQGHYHTTGCVKYLANSTALRWGMNVSCMVDQKHLAFIYSKTMAKSFVMGCGVIINDIPKFVPMFVDKGKWLGNL